MVDSSNASQSAFKDASLNTAFLRPPPWRRIRPGANLAGSFNSAIPCRITGRDMPVHAELPKEPRCVRLAVGVAPRTPSFLIRSIRVTMLLDATCLTISWRTDLLRTTARHSATTRPSASMKGMVGRRRSDFLLGWKIAMPPMSAAGMCMARAIYPTLSNCRTETHRIGTPAISRGRAAAKPTGRATRIFQNRERVPKTPGENYCRIYRFETAIDDRSRACCIIDTGLDRKLVQDCY